MWFNDEGKWMDIFESPNKYADNIVRTGKEGLLSDDNIDYGSFPVREALCVLLSDILLRIAYNGFHVHPDTTKINNMLDFKKRRTLLFREILKEELDIACLQEVCDAELVRLEEATRIYESGMTREEFSQQMGKLVKSEKHMELYFRLAEKYQMVCPLKENRTIMTACALVRREYTVENDKEYEIEVREKLDAINNTIKNDMAGRFVLFNVKTANQRFMVISAHGQSGKDQDVRNLFWGVIQKMQQSRKLPFIGGLDANQKKECFNLKNCIKTLDCMFCDGGLPSSRKCRSVAQVQKEKINKSESKNIDQIVFSPATVKSAGKPRRVPDTGTYILEVEGENGIVDKQVTLSFDKDTMFPAPGVWSDHFGLICELTISDN